MSDRPSAWTEESFPADYTAVARAVTILHTAEQRGVKYPLMKQIRHLLSSLSARFRDVLETFPPGSAAGMITARENVHGWAEAEVLARGVIASPVFRPRGGGR